MQSSDFDTTGVSKEDSAYLSASTSSKELFSENDTESLQFESEDNLNSLHKKTETFENEISSFQEKRNEKPKIDVTEKRKSTSGEKSSKKFKSSNSKAHVSTATNHQKNQNAQNSKLSDHDSNVLMDTPKVQKADNPNRFWSFLDPYCAEITQEDIKTVEDWIKSHENDNEYQGIPSLGEHFTHKWIHEDMLEEMKEGSKSVECPKGFIDENSCNIKEKEDLLQRARNECFKLQQPVSGSLTERLVSVLIEENLMTSLDEMNDVCTSDIIPKSNTQKPTIPLVGESLEMRLCKEFLHNGIIESEGTVYDPDDELLAELKRLQSSIKPISEYNKCQKKKLLLMAKAEVKRQEVKMKLQECDAKVMEFYRAMAAARLKKKKFNKKEQEQIINILKVRSSLTLELDKS